MSKKDHIEMRGKIEEIKQNHCFVLLENGQRVIATIGGKLKKNRIRLVIGDDVKVNLSPYDLTKGFISYRF